MTCRCGCGLDSGLYLYTDSRTGSVKGEPRRFLPGHSTAFRLLRPLTDPPPPRLCACGCRRMSGFYIRTDNGNDQIKGWPRRFLPGHSRHAPRRPACRPATRVDWGRFVPPGRGASVDLVPEGCPLSNMEYRVVQIIADGLHMKVAAAMIGISTSTVRGHMMRVFTALGLVDRRAVAAVALMKDMGWLGAPPRAPAERDGPLPVQHLAYTAAFTRLVLERTLHCENMVTVAFMLLCMHTGFKPSSPRRAPDIEELLLRMARGLSRPIYAGLEPSSRDVLTILG